MRHRAGAAPGRTTWRRRWRGLLPVLVVLPVASVLSAVALPGAAAGTLPWPVRSPAPHARLAAAGPSPSAYPYRVGPAPTLDAYGFVTGQCTSFVAWWLNSRGLPFAVITVGPAGAGRFLNAASWDSAARDAGYRVDDRPAVGVIAQWRSGESSLRRDDDGSWHRITAGEPGHVAVVVRVRPDGQAEWLDYGWGGRSRLHHGSGFAPRYLYLGVPPPPG